MYKRQVEQVVQAAVALCRQAAEPCGALTALDIGPLGEMLEPGGPLSFQLIKVCKRLQKNQVCARLRACTDDAPKRCV